MANFDLNEQKMLTKYYGEEHLETDDSFWMDVMANYQNKVIRIPLQENHINRRRLMDMLVCTGDGCDDCCHYDRVPLNQNDLRRFINNGIEADIMVEKDKPYLNTKGGCKFLQDGKCSIYNIRPDVCMEFPIQTPVDVVYDGGKAKQMQYRVKCFPSILVIREIMTEACQGGMMLMPDLSLIQRGVKKDADTST